MRTAFADRAALVTGASRGIGREMAVQLARRGARIALMARNADELEATAGLCRDEGAQALVLPGDVSVEADCEAAFTGRAPSSERWTC